MLTMPFSTSPTTANVSRSASVLGVEVDQASSADAERIALIEAATATPSDDAEPTVGFDDATASSGEVLEAAIQRLESSGASPNVRAAVDGLHALGYVLRPCQDHRSLARSPGTTWLCQPGVCRHEKAGYLHA